jgi:hypothetical protein
MNLLEATIEFLRIEIKALERERDYLQAKLVIQAINADEEKHIGGSHET